VYRQGRQGRQGCGEAGEPRAASGQRSAISRSRELRARSSQRSAVSGQRSAEAATAEALRHFFLLHPTTAHRPPTTAFSPCPPLPFVLLCMLLPAIWQQHLGSATPDPTLDRHSVIATRIRQARAAARGKEKADHMPEAAAFLKALADLAWAVIAAGALVAFRKEIASALTRLRRAKISKDAGIEFELDELNRMATAASAQVPVLPTSEPQALPENPTPESDEQALADAAKSPRVALVVLGTQIEHELRQLLGAMGTVHGTRYTSLANALGRLQLPRDLGAALAQFWTVRNKLVHGSSVDPDDIARVLDSGLRILHSLRAIPREVNVVYHPGVDVYADPDCRSVREGVKAVILETTRSDVSGKTLRAFPTTRRHFQTGKQVAWEWSAAKVFPESWYRDPDTGEVKYGWTESMEFVGRHLESD